MKEASSLNNNFVATVYTSGILNYISVRILHYATCLFCVFINFDRTAAP